MKKIMTFSIILMPLIALCIMFLGGTIITRSTYLFVEHIEFAETDVVLNKPTDEDVSQTLQVNIFPILANNKNVEFWSGDEDIVTIDKNGKITSQDFGETYVYVKSKENGTKRASCKVLVTSDRVHRVWAENTISTIYVGDTHSFNIKYAPVEALDVDFTLTSSDPNVVYVSKSGELIGRGKGNATITISLTSNPSVNYSFDVKSKVRVQDIYLDDASPVVSGLKEFTYPKVNFMPNNAEEMIYYSSSDTSVATVDESGKITFLKEGTVKIFAKSDDFDKVLEKTYTSTFGYYTDVSFSNLNEKDIKFEDYINQNLTLLWSGLPSDADPQNISFKSDNPSVLKVENGEIKVVGGGTATITIVAKAPENKTKEATITINVSRLAENIEMQHSPFTYTSLKNLNLSATIYPQDSTEKVVWTVSDTSLASVENNKLIFTSKVINNLYGKVKVTASTQNVSKTITIAYIDSSIQQISLENVNELNFVMPKTGENPYVFALIVNSENISDVELKTESGEDCISQNGYIFTLTNNGQAEVGVYLNGEESSDKIVDVVITREVEEINDVKIFATWEGVESEEFLETDTIYSSSKTFEFTYTLFPTTATLTSATAQIEGDGANIIDGKVEFNKPSKVKLVLSVDGVTKKIEIESTCLRPDQNTVVCENINLTKGQNVSIYDYITLSPEHADRKFITYQAVGDAISIDSSGNVLGVLGGNAQINLLILSNKGNIGKTIDVYVAESAENVEVLGDEYLFVGEQNLDVSNKFKVLPETANINKNLTFGVENENVASISKQGILTFKKEGHTIVFAKLENLTIAKIAVVFVKDSLILNGEQENFKVLKGTKFVIEPSQDAKTRAKFDEEFVVDNGILEDKIFITLTESTTISFSGEEYNFDCVNEITSLKLEPTNLEDVDLSGANYVTGLEEIQLTREVFGTDESYLNLVYSVSDNEIATISNTGLLKFKKAGSVEITLTATYKTEVIGSVGISKQISIIVESTFGQITRIVAKDGGNYTLTIDDNNNLNNIKDIRDYLEVYPTQIQLSTENLKLKLSDNSMANVNGLNLEFVKGGEADVEVQIKANDKFVLGTSVKFNVKRNATAIYLDGEEIVDGQERQIHKSTMFIKPSAYPVDANINYEIAWEVIQNNNTAEVDNNKITFKKVNEQIAIKFTLGKNENAKEFIVYFKTTIITFEVDVESETYVVPMKEAFTFVSTDELTDLSVTFSSNFTQIENVTADVYKVNETNVGTATISYNGQTKTVKFVSTTNIQEIEDVKLSDVNMNGTLEEINTTENELSLTTASTSVEVLYNIPTGFDRFGNQIEYVLSVNNEVAEISSENKNKVVFLTEGSTTVTLKIVFEDAYQERTLTYSFIVQSTYNKVTQFSVSKKDYNLTYDDLTDEEKIIDVLQTVTRIAPLYGEVSEKTLVSKKESVVKIENNKVKICGSGTGSVEIGWGKATETINFVVDKYIDEINFIENGEIITQIVTKSSTYKLNYNFIANDNNFKETLKDVYFQTTDNCEVSNNIVTLNNENEKYEIIIKAVSGTASAKLIIIRVSADVNVIKATTELENITIKKDEINIFDFRFNETVVSLNEIESESISLENSVIQTFKGLNGASGNLTFDNGQNIGFVITEEVEEIRFKEGAVEDNLLTAMGSAEDGNEIDLVEYYGAYVYPETARNETGAYQIEYSVQNADTKTRETIAYIENGKLYFTSQGKVIITFKANNVEVSRTIESTMGYAKTVTLKDNTRLLLEFADQQYNISEDYYSVSPKNAYKANVTFSPETSGVFDVLNNNTLSFVGGGKTNLVLTYSLSEEETGTLKQEVYVKNRAKGIKFFDGENEVGYMVKNNAVSSTMILSYDILSDGVLSDYNIVFDSSNKNVASVEKINGKCVVTFKTLGETTIIVKVQEKLNLDSAETEDDFDAIGELKLIYRPNYNIIEVKSDVDLTLEFVDEKPNILYPILNKNVSEFEFGVQTGNAITINSFGEIAKNLGGEATIKVQEKDGDWNKTVEVYVHKVARIEISIPEIYKESTTSYDIYTSKTEFNISSVVTFFTTDAMIRKTIEYVSSNKNIAKIENGTIKFETAGSVVITINVYYNGEIETTESFTIYSSFDRVESFDLSCNISKTDDTYVVYTHESPILFTISNVKPKDYVGAVSDLIFSSTNEEAFSITATDFKNFKVTPIKAGTGEFTVRYNSEDSGTFKNIKVEIKQLSTSVVIQHNNITIESLKTFDNIINLTAVVGPTDANNKFVNWKLSVISGSATKTSDGNNPNSVQVEFSDYGKVILTAQAQDGGAEDYSVTLEYVKDIEGFTISTTQIDESGTKTVTFDESTENQIAYLEWNQTSITFKITVLPKEDFTGFNNYAKFTIITANGRTATIDSEGNFTIQTDSIETSPIYEDTITLSYQEKYSGSLTVKIYRDGLQKIDFGDHNTTKDEECGLQQLRVYGYKSYYDGIQDYYRMDVNIINNNTNVSLNDDTQPNFTNEVVWNSSDASVTIQAIGKGYVDINFASISTKNSFDDIYNYDSKTTDLTKGVVTIYASNKAGRVLCSYTFRIVDGVNIFDQAGYVNAGANIVLQKSFGHDDQQTLIDSGKYVKLEAYVAKTTIYGNGHLMNFAYRNTFTSESTYTSYDNIQVSINKIVNIKIQGSNYDSTYDTYNIELTSVQKIAYSELYYMYRSIEISSGTVYVRKCLLRSFKSSGIIGSSDGTKNLYLEDIIMFDVGQRAIELQKNATGYVKGFLDVYNFQNKDNVQAILGDLGKLDFTGQASKTIMNLAKDNDLIVTKNNQDWVNMVGISTKGTDLKMYYYNNTSNEYEYKEDGEHDSAPGLIRISKNIVVAKITAWSYKSGHDYLTWEHEFNSDGSLNSQYLISTTTKITRLGNEISIGG